MLLKKKMARCRTELIWAALGLFMLALWPVRGASGDCPGLGAQITHNLSASFCELCGTGEVVIRFTQPSRDTDLTQLVVREDLRSSGLIYIPGSTTFTVRYGTAPVAFDPAVSGADLTWDLRDYVLGRDQYLEIRFQVRRPAGNQEELVHADRRIQAFVDFSSINEDNHFTPCSDSLASGLQELPIRQPLPFVSKYGRNIDAGQGGYSDPVYGNNNDDVIWRIHVENQGAAGLQDLRINDVMDTGNLDLRFRCPSEPEAVAVANNNGNLPAVSQCEAITGNVLLNFEVDNPYGTPAHDSPDLVDAPAHGAADIFLVGKITADGSCTGPRTNRVSDVEWGCEATSGSDAQAGGIATPASSNGITPSVDTEDTARLSTVALPGGMTVQTAITGIDASQPVGTKGRVRVTITNHTGGTVKNIKLRDVLPPEYVVDPTFDPRVQMAPAYGAQYRGMTDSITWTNPVPGTFPDLTSTNPDDPLANTAPEFTLWSSTDHDDYPAPDQVNMMRHGDVLRVTFRIVLVRSQSYDKTAHLDVRSEAPDSDPPGTDPDNAIQLTNRLFVDYENFCQPGVIQHPPTNPLETTHWSRPEDLDIDIDGGDLIFVLTGDANQRLPLTVDLRNRGGHDARDYFAYVAFGQGISVADVPSACRAEANPPPMPVWRLPADIPATASVYHCDAGTISPNQTRSFTFQVLKNPTAAEDDLTFRADVLGEITLSDGTRLWFPRPTARADGVLDRANDYSLDGIRARVIGFDLRKRQEGFCSEEPPAMAPDTRVQIGEECTYRIDTGGWFGFQTPGFNYIAVEKVQVVDQVPDGQAYISSTNPLDEGTTSAIKGISLNPPGLSALQETWFDWTFNQTDRITQKDEWFHVDTVSRLLNKPVDVSAAPNVHAALSRNVLESTFDAIFYNPILGREEIYTITSETVGYPREAVRRVDLTVSEPHLSVVKEVCNETLYGIGPACSNFVALADDGDAYDGYIYRLTITNEAAADSVPRAPAYDVTVTDRLDASDLAYVLPFGGDGLDNDGDGVAGGADAGGEGTISDNTVRNGVPAQITFSYTHSDPLLRIDAGQSVRLYYRVDYDDDAAPLQTFTNAATAAYDSLEGLSGQQSAPQRPTSDIGGARAYLSDPGSAAVRIIPVQTRPKRIARLSNTPLTSGPDPQGVSIGEEIEYRLNTMLPVALLRAFVIRDELPAGLSCTEAPVVDLNAPPYSAAGFSPGGIVTPTCSGGLVEWDFGDQRVTNGNVGDRYDFEIGFIARVDNTAGTNDGDVLSNGNPATSATAGYIDEAGHAVELDFGQVDVRVREPRIALTKTFAAVDADAGDVLTVTVTATNTGTAAAYNLRVLDDLRGRHLTFTGSVAGSDPPDTVDSATFGPNQPVFSWNRPAGIASGAAISFTFDVRVDDVVQPHEILDNTIQADWTSLPGPATALNSSGAIGADGSAAGMRIGALPNAGDPVNDYESQAAGQTVVPPLALAKTDLDAAVIPTIGAHKRFQLDVRLPEGVTHGVIATDSLNAAGVSYLLENNAAFDVTYTFQNIATINGQAPAEAAFNAFPADNTAGSAVWDIGTVVTQVENDPARQAVDPLIRIQYFARVNNDTDTDRGDALHNAAVLNYTHGETGGQEALADDAAPVTVVEPVLTVIKTVGNVTPGKQPADPPAGGDLLEYVVTVLNSGTATAHDVNMVDTLPAGLSFYGGFTPTAVINGTAVAGFAGTPADAPNGPLVWGRDNGDESLDIPVGQTLLLTYRTVVLAAGGDLSNRVMIDWTSLDGPSGYERTGDGCPAWTAPNDYCAGPAVATTTTVDTNSVAKTVGADTFDSPPSSTAADAVARVGDIIIYRLALNLSGGLTRSLQVQDSLPGGMAFAGTVSINGDSSADYTPPAAGAGSNFAYAPIGAADTPSVGQTGLLTWAIGDVVNDPFGDSTTDTLVIVYRARILPDAGIAHVASTTLTNTVQMTYATAAGPAPAQADSAAVTVVQPVLAVAKSAVASGGDMVLAAGETVTYTVDIANTGGGPAYDMLLTDIIPEGMRSGAAAITVVRTELLSGTGLPVLTPGYDAASGTATWDFDTGAAGPYVIPAGDTLRIVYELTADATLGAGRTLTNAAQVQHYYSFDDEDVPSQGGVTGERQDYGPTNIASVTFTTDTPDRLIKQNPAALGAAVGEPFTYRVTVPATAQETALHDVRILDDLGASAADLRFVSVAKVSGSQPWTPVNTGTATSLVIEDPALGIDIPAGEQIAVDITVVLDDTATNVSGLTFDNTADYTYNQVSDDPATQAPGGPDTTGDMTIVGADSVTLEKSGPATMQLETPGAYRLNFHNTSTGTVWNPVITDRLPDEAAGGMCGAGPDNVTAQIFLSDGVTPLSAPLVAGTDFTVSFAGAPTCEWRFALLSAAGGVPSDHRLIVTYALALDPDTQNGTTLTNVAGATQWYSADPNVPGAAPRIFQHELTDGTPGTLDQQDAHTITAEAPILVFTKSVRNVTTGQDPGVNASPGDTLHYTLRIENSGPIGLPSFSIVDDLGRLNGQPVFAPGSLVLIGVPAGADPSGTDASGGTNGTGLVNIDGLSIGAQGEAGATLVVEFEATLAPVITSGTVVLNQAGLVTANPNPLYSDDPNQAGQTDPTRTLIASLPDFRVLKTSTDLSGDPAVLMAGETLRYTLTIKNIGSEDAVQVRLRDYIPANTTYVVNSTTLNGHAVPDAAPGISPLEAGMPIHTDQDATAGSMPADAAPGAGNVASVTFDVVVDSGAMDGLIIENQGFVGGSGAGSGPLPEQPSDDPATPIPDDPTCDVVGNLPLLYAHKTVAISRDFGSPGIVDPGDGLRYTIVISNLGAIAATSVVLTDTVPANITYVADSLRLNGFPVGTDNGVSPLVAGLPVNSGDNPGPGIISPGAAAVITFEALVDPGVPTGTLISNQGSVASAELPPEPTDADGLASNGDQPTVVVVGDAQLLSISKEVLIPDGGAAEAGGQLAYVIRVANIGSLPATRVVVRDDLNPPLGDQVAYVDGSGTLNGAAGGVSVAGGVMIADYATVFGDLPPGASAVVRFRVQIDPALAIGTTITNTGVVSWSDPAQTATASVSIDVGGTPGSGALNGNVWHDANLDKLLDDTAETRLEGWSVELYRHNQLVSTVTTDAGGAYRLSGLLANAGTSDLYELRFRAAGAGANTPSLGYADSPFTDGPQRISGITVAAGGNLQNLNLPIWPNGAVYNSVVRQPVAGARLALLNAATGAALPSRCFDDPVQQNQITAQDGFYKFDLNFSDGACPAGGAYLIQVAPPSSGYQAMPSQIIPPASDAGTAPFSIPACPGSADDAVAATVEYCEAVASAGVPPASVEPRTTGTVYYLHLLLSNATVPGQSQIFNNPIPVDPVLDGAVAITKTASLLNATKGALVPYTITVTNVFGVPLYDIGIVDRFPAGFKYVAGSARLNGAAVEPHINGRELIWDGLQLQVNQKQTLQLLLVVGAGVSEGEYVNRAQVRNTATGAAVSGEATATVQVIPDPDFDCTDVIGKVFDDRNLNGRQDQGEKGLPGVRVVTARGLIAGTDEFGRFHITCAAVPDEDLGSNFILKLDERSLPTGFRLTTENPRVQRATRGKMIRFNFGATIHRVVRIDIADGVFEPATSDLRPQWAPKIDQLLAELKKAPSVLRLSYLADVESDGLVRDRLDALKDKIENRWRASDVGYRLSVETEIFWRRGAPFDGR